MLNKSLDELKPGEKGRVVKTAGSGSVYRRILDMGIVKGAEIRVQRVAPLGDPIEVEIKGYHLSLRKNEAANIYMEV